MQHGGDLGALDGGDSGGADAQTLPAVDLSTGIAPTPYPFSPVPIEAWQRLPQHADLAHLLTTARTAYGAPDNAPIVAAPGTQLLIQLLPRALRGSFFDGAHTDATAVIIGPTYSEHAICWRRAGAEVIEVPDLERALGVLGSVSGPGVLVLGQPNNPDGRFWAPERLVAVSRQLSDQGHFLIVDEAFADLAPSISLCPWLADENLGNLIILRSFGKFFGLAGVRLGFALGSKIVVGLLDREMGPWAVPGPALIIGAQALADAGWSKAARDRYRAGADALDDMLRGAGLTVRGGTSLFRLVEHQDAAKYLAECARHKILVRRWQEYPHWMRFGLPAGRQEAERLEFALMAGANGVPDERVIGT